MSASQIRWRVLPRQRGDAPGERYWEGWTGQGVVYLIGGMDKAGWSLRVRREGAPSWRDLREGIATKARAQQAAERHLSQRAERLRLRLFTASAM